jgi:hypothetical protein
MNPPHADSEEALELQTIALFEQVGYTTPIRIIRERLKTNVHGQA